LLDAAALPGHLLDDIAKYDAGAGGHQLLEQRPCRRECRCGQLSGLVGPDNRFQRTRPRFRKSTNSSSAVSPTQSIVRHAATSPAH